jgi:hypothetical protein
VIRSTATASISTAFLLLLIILLQGCGSSSIGTVPVRNREDYYDIYPGFAAGDTASASGRARIEFENYRFRGKFRYRRKGGNLRVDFTHSSLLGAVEAEGTLFISPEGIILFDQKEGRLYRNDQCARMIEEAVGAAVEPGDVMLALQLSYPGYPEIVTAETAAEGRRWKLICICRSRELELSGEQPGRLDLLKIRRTDGEWSFEIGYHYGSFGGHYPERIVITGSDESVRITLKVENYGEGPEKV